MNVPEKAMELKAIIVAALAFVTGFLGWVGIAVLIFLAAMFLDYITGSWAAKAHGEWSSKIAREGLWHKLGEIAALLVAALCDIAVGVIISTAAAKLLPVEYTYKGYITLIVSIWYLFTELGSILENISKLGAPVPAWMIEGVGKMKKKIDKHGADKVTVLDEKPDTEPIDRALVETSEDQNEDN